LLSIVAVAVGVSGCGADCSCEDEDSTLSDAGVDCEAEPSECADLGDEAAQHFGCCFEGTVYWCAGGTLDSIACEAYGYLCGYSETSDFMDCT
jgi:hypothetical protein